MTAIILLTVLVCMVGAGFFAGIETGIISIHPVRLRHFVRQGLSKAKVVQHFFNNTDRLLGATLVGTNLCIVVMSVLSASLAEHFAGAAGEAVSTVVMSIAVLIFCEYIPKAWFRAQPFERSRRYIGVLRFSELFFLPLSGSLIWITRLLLPRSPHSFSKSLPLVTKDDLKNLASDGEKSGVLSPKERVMIHRVIELSSKHAGEIVIPRERMTMVSTDTTIQEFFVRSRASGFTRMPVLDEKINKFVGMVNVFYALSLDEKELQKPVSEIMRPISFISEDMPVDDIFPRLRRFHQPICLVTNEKADVVGLITTEDILEEIVGRL